MASREELKEQKEKTSNALIEAAVQLCAEEGYASLSIRSVARKAGIAPTSFYRHFRDIDELGVAIVEQAKNVLDICLGQARKKMSASGFAQKASPKQMLESIESITRPFVETFMDFFEKDSHLLCLFFQEGTGSSEPVRTAISGEIDIMAGCLGEDLAHIGGGIAPGFGETRLIAESMITIVGHNGVLMMLQKLDRREMIEQLIRKLNLLLLGASIYGQINQGKKDE